MRIAYFCNNNINSYFQFEKIYQELKKYDIEIYLAAFKMHLPYSVPINFCLDSFHIDGKEMLNINIPYISILGKELEEFSPDLIISDLSKYAYFVSESLSIPLWNCSSRLLHFSSDYIKYNYNYTQEYFDALLFLDRRVSHLYKNMIDSAKKNLIYSHIGNAIKDVHISNQFEWCKPYYQIFEKTDNKDIAIVDAEFEYNFYNYLNINKQNYFSIYENNLSKSFKDKDYNLINNTFVICRGEPFVLHDAFYNKKHTIIVPNAFDFDCNVYANYNHFTNLSYRYNLPEDIELKEKIIDINNQKIPQLHEYLNLKGNI